MIFAEQPNMGASSFHSKQKLQSPNRHFLSLTIYPDNSKMIAEVFVPSSIILNRWASDLIKVAQAQPQNILIPKQYKVAEKTACGEGVTLEIEFDSYYIPLSEEIRKRRQRETYLEEAQMWYLLFCLTESAASCQKIGYRIGDVNPNNILLSKSGKLKIISRFSVPNYCDAILDTNYKDNYLSPEELQIISKGLKEFPIDFVLAESFSIGMTLLSAGTLLDLVKCYDYKKLQLKKIQFNKILDFWQQNEFYSEFQKRKIHYSDQLKSIVNGLLQISPLKRKTSLQIYNMLKRHMVAIMKMQPFDLGSRKLSPINKLDFIKRKDKLQSIHILRAKKRSQLQCSPKKDTLNDKVKNTTSEKQLQFSFGFPSTNPSNIKNSTQVSVSPAKKIKLTKTLHFSKKFQGSK